ncbi:MAG: hypothetical protein Q7U91_08895 [Sideroxyarcus sp.]|nr:hypothetical protein [Sideroxyarcus sp.]
MSKNPDNPDDLRAIAEQLLCSAPPAKTPVQSVGELQHELEVHRIELEMQNEHLRQSYQELEESRDRYVNFFDFAPVGYLTLNSDGMIDEINLTAASLLGVERSKLLQYRFAPWLPPKRGTTGIGIFCVC